MIRRTIQSAHNVAPVTIRSINQHLLDTAAITLRRFIRKTQLKNQPDVGHAQRIAAPFGRTFVGYEISVRMKIEVALRQLQPEVHQETASFESVRWDPKRSREHADRRHQPELPPVKFFQSR